MKALENKQSHTYFAILLASIVAIMPFSIDTYLPAIPVIAKDLQTNIHQIEITLALFLLGSALAQLVAGFYSDKKGRRIIVLIGLVVFIFGSLGLARSNTVLEFQLFRVLQAVGGGCCSVVVAASVRDRFSGSDAARIFALIGLIMLGAPLLAPMIGSLLLQFFTWSSVFYFLAFYGCIVLIVVFLFFQSAVPIHNYQNYLPLHQQLINNYRIVLTERRALGYLFFQIASFSSMFAFLTESSFVYMELYHVSEFTFSLLFALNIIVMAIFNRITAYKLRSTSPQKILLFGVFLQILINSSLLVIAFLGHPSLFLLIPLIALSVGSQGFITANTTACYMDYFKKNAGTATATSGTMSAFIAACVGFITAQVHDGLTIKPMVIMMFISSFLGICLLFYFSQDMRKVLLKKYSCITK